MTGEAAAHTGRYADAAELDAELAELQDALLADGLERVAWGDVADFRWQVATFGFHLASLEIRQHAAVHRAALEALRTGRPGTTEVAAGVTLDEVLETFRAIGDAQARMGPEACHRVIVSFTATASDVTDVLELAAWAMPGAAAAGPRRRAALRVVRRARRGRLRSSRRSSPTRAIGPTWPAAAIARR